MQEDSLSVSKLFGLIFFFFFHVRIEKLGLYLSIYLSIHPAIHPSIYPSLSKVLFWCINLKNISFLTGAWY